MASGTDLTERHRAFAVRSWVLDWNTASIDSCKAAGAVPMDEWTVFRLTEEALSTCATLR